MKKIILAIAAVFLFALAGTATLLVHAVAQQNIATTVVTPLAQVPVTAITATEAQAIAVRHVGGTVAQLELVSSNGQAVYDIELNKDGREYDVTIDAATGAVLTVEEEMTEHEAATTLASAPHNVSESEAIAIARNHTQGTLAETELERKGSILVYAIEFKNGRQSTEVLVAVETGEVLGIEIENEDDDD